MLSAARFTSTPPNHPRKAKKSVSMGFDKQPEGRYDGRMMSDHQALEADKAEIPVERVSLLISLVVVGLTISLVLDLPSRVVDFSLLGSRATFIFSGAWLFAILLATLTATGVESIHRTHPRVHHAHTQYSAILWVLPSLLVALAALAIPSFATIKPLGFAAVLLTAVLLNLVILGEYHTIEMEDRAYSISRLGLNLATYALAFVLFWPLYLLKLRAIMSAPVIVVVSTLLALELLRGTEVRVSRTWLYAFTVGLAMGELLWAMSYWSVSGLFAGVLLTVAFYILTSAAQQYLWGYLSRAMVLEFAAVVIIVLFLLLRFGH